jgi:outer membrane receptor for ferrienterochelin and colicin
MKPWLAAALLAPAAHAAAMAALPDGHVLEEVMVTARRMAEDAARTPLSIDVISAAELGKGGVEDLASLASRVPGLSFEALWGGQGAAVMMRGLSQPSTAGDNVGVFVDDVYQAGRSRTWTCWTSTASRSSADPRTPCSGAAPLPAPSGSCRPCPPPPPGIA